MTTGAEWAGGRAADWRDDALCVQVGDKELFFPNPDVGTSLHDAQRVCMRCRVRVACLTFALDHEIEYGVYGGTSETARRRMRRQRKAAA